MIKFVQSGDFHLDSITETTGNSLAAHLLLLDSFGAVVETVKQVDAKLLFLTGDLFDNDGIRSETIDYLTAKLEEIPETKVFITPGNHDFIGRNSAWINIEWPANVHVFTDFEPVFVDDLNIMIHGAGFRERIQSTTILPPLAFLDPRWPNFLIMHGDLGKTSSYNPLDLDQLDQFDYCALGHRHEFQQSGQRGTIVYAGNPCARNFLETGVKGCVIGSLDKGTIKVQFQPFDFPAYHTINLDVSGIKTNAEVRGMIKQVVLCEKDHYKITLIGRNSIEHELGYLTQNIAAATLEIVDDTKYQRDYDSLKSELSLQGVFARRMLELSETEPLALEALEAGLDALEGESKR